MITMSDLISATSHQPVKHNEYTTSGSIYIQPTSLSTLYRIISNKEVDKSFMVTLLTQFQLEIN